MRYDPRQARERLGTVLVSYAQAAALGEFLPRSSDRSPTRLAAASVADMTWRRLAEPQHMQCNICSIGSLPNEGIFHKLAKAYRKSPFVGYFPMMINYKAYSFWDRGG